MPDETEGQRPARHVFVYGSLRRGGCNDITRLQPSPQWGGGARVRGTLYHLGRYPGLLLRGQDTVVGEVYAIAAALEARLDAIEGIRPGPEDEYRKREVDVELRGCTLRCLIYEINPAYIGPASRIAHGDWLRVA